METGANGLQRAPAEAGIQITEWAKVAAENGTGMGGAVAPGSAGKARSAARRRSDAVRVGLRVACLAASVLSLSIMVTSEQSGAVDVYGFQLPLNSKWSFSESLEYVAAAAAAVAAHSLLQLLLAAVRMVRGLPVTPSRGHAWIIFAGDQVFAYAMMSAGSAAAGVSNLNRTGIRHTPLPDFCKPLHRFCSRVAISITFAFVSWLLLAASAVLDILWLLKF